jgi:hypothetical protein
MKKLLSVFILGLCLSYSLTGAKKISPSNGHSDESVPAPVSTVETDTETYVPTTEELFFLDILANPRGQSPDAANELNRRREEVFSAAYHCLTACDSCNKLIATIHMHPGHDDFAAIDLLDGNVNCTGFLFETPLVAALENGKFNLAIELIARGAHIRTPRPGLYTEMEILLLSMIGRDFYDAFDFERTFAALLRISPPPSTFVLDLLALNPSQLILSVFKTVNRLCPGLIEFARYADLKSLVSIAEIRNSNDPERFRKRLAEALLRNHSGVVAFEGWAQSHLPE